MTDVLVYIEINSEYKIENVGKEIISYVRNNFNDTSISAVIATDNVHINNAYNELSKLAVDKLYLIKNDILYRAEANTIAMALKALITDVKPDIFLVGATPSGREIAPRLASKLEIGLTADCTELALDEKGDLLATRPTYGGKMLATIYSKTKPNCATIRPGAFKLLPTDNTNPEIIEFFVDFDNVSNRIEILKSELIKAPDDWTNSDIIIAGGLGLQSAENFDLIYKFADKIGAKPAASRAVVERGWAPYDIQVGQTGKSVSPKLYIAFGISGAMQHVVGITNSDKIIAINTDKDAPIMKLADIAINNDAISTLNKLLNMSN